MISLHKCYGSCNAIDHLSTKICVPSKTKYINVKLFNLIAKINKAKIPVKHILCACKWKFNSATCNSNQKWKNDKYQCERTSVIFYDDTIKFEDFDFGNILLDQKSYKSILNYDVLYRTLIGSKIVCIRLDKAKRVYEKL